MTDSVIKNAFIFRSEKNLESENLLSEKLISELNLDELNCLEDLTDEQVAFQFVDNKLQLHIFLDGKLNNISFDFVEGDVAFRAARVSKSNELVAKAIGCKPHYRPNILDATAGMGRDALVMASLGCNVLMQERNSIIFQLLNNALERFKQDTGYKKLSGNLKLIQADSLLSLKNLKDIDVIYLDPMFPERKKKSLVKKEMRLFKRLAGDDPDADELFKLAIKSSVKRVVVKRPKGAECLANQKPSHEIVAKKFRYDVYLLNS